MTNKDLRELDAWIAEHVMGWKRGKRYGNGNGEWELPNGGIKYWTNTPSFSCDPAAAMEVLKKCGDKTSVAVSHTCRWMVNDLDKKSRFEINESLELAICLFAKKLFSK